MSDQESSRRVQQMLSKVNQELQPGLNEPIQEEIAQLINLLPDLEKLSDSSLIGSAEIAVSALLLQQPNLALASRIREAIAGRVKAETRNPFRTFLRTVVVSDAPSTRVVLGLAVLLYFALPFATIYVPGGFRSTKIFGIDTSMLLLVAVAGALGSIVSIMVRIQDFSGLTTTDPSILFYTGLFKPIVGTAFALFVFAAFKSGIIPVTIDPDKETYFFIMLSFVSGFSERFARDIATETERQVSRL